LNKGKRLYLWLISGFLMVMVFAAGCIPAAEGEVAEEGSSPWIMIVFLVLLFVMFYFLMIRPQRKRQKEQKELLSDIKKGDRVVTSGGIYGQIESVSEESVVLKIESGQTIRIARNSIANKRTTN